MGDFSLPGWVRDAIGPHRNVPLAQLSGGTLRGTELPFVQKKSHLSLRCLEVSPPSNVLED